MNQESLFGESKVRSSTDFNAQKNSKQMFSRLTSPSHILNGTHGIANWTEKSPIKKAHDMKLKYELKLFNTSYGLDLKTCKPIKNSVFLRNTKLMIEYTSTLLEI